MSEKTCGARLVLGLDYDHPVVCVLPEHVGHHEHPDTTLVRKTGAAILEATRHLLGKCDCHEKYGPNDVTCCSLAEMALSPFVEVSEAPKYEHRLRAEFQR